MEDARRQEAEKEAAARCATERQILEDAAHLVAVWNDRQARRMPMLFSPTIGAAITAGYWFLRARLPGHCRTTGDVDLRTLDWHRACRGCHGPYPGTVPGADPAGRTRRLPNWFVCRSRALPRSITQSAAATGGLAKVKLGKPGEKRRANADD